MNFEDLKDQARERLATVWSRVQESSLFNNLRDRYETLPSIAQRAVAFAGGFIVLFLVLSIPYAYISSAGTSIDEFNEYRGLIRNLLRVGRSANEPSPLPPGLSGNELDARAQAILAEFKLIPEQIVASKELTGERPAGSLAPPNLSQHGISLTLKKLNLNQLLDIGHRLQTINAGVKMIGLDMIANAEDNHYYDVTYRLVSFSLPSMPELPGGGEPPAGKEKGKPAPAKRDTLKQGDEE